MDWDWDDLKKATVYTLKLCVYIMIMSAMLLFLLGSADKELVMKGIYLSFTFGAIAIVSIWSFGGLIIFFNSHGKEITIRNFMPDRGENNYKEYYRDILQLKSPLLISIVDDYEILEKDLVAELLYLKLHGIIELENERIVIKENNDFNFSHIDKIIINNIMVNGKIFVKRKELRTILACEASKLNLFKYKKVDGEKDIKKWEMIVNIIYVIGILMYSFSFGSFWWVAMIISLIFVLMPYELIEGLKEGKYKDVYKILTKKDKLILRVSLFLCLLCAIAGKSFLAAITSSINLIFSICYIVYRVKYVKEVNNMPYIRTKQGEELNKKIEGLKNYTRDYSLLGEKKAKEIELWEDYLVYSVIWGQNEKIVDEYKKYVSLITDK